VSAPHPLGSHAIPVPLPSGDLTPDGPSYEVMFLLDADDDRIAALRAALAPLGDSLVVVGGDGLWNVHVHVDDVGAAVEAGIEAGRPHRVRVTHFAEQVHRAGPAVRQGRTVVAVAAGAGLGDLFVEAGATVVPGGPGRRPSTGQIVEAVTSAGAAEVIVLPNDSDSIAAAEAAARTVRESGDVRVAVIRTDAQVQGLAALAVHEPGRTFEEDIVTMSAAARHARAGSVTVASRQAMTTAGPCEPGDVLGMIEGDFVLVGDDLFTVATTVLERLLGGGGELVTVVAGADAGDLAERCASHLHDTHPTVDVLVYDGGQPGYPLLVGVE
jgi:dihydroxyacetone kinase-like predicted kinase